MARGTEAFPDLGQHCEHEDCNQLDFLPFTCQSCQSVFCLRHRTREAHGCPKAEHGSRVVVVCDACALSIEKRAGEADAAALERHEKSGSCDPSKKRKKPKCPVNRCKEALSFSNTSTCKACNQKVCLKHRFPSDHDCNRRPLLLPARNGKACGGRQGSVSPPPPPPPTIKAC